MDGRESAEAPASEAEVARPTRRCPNYRRRSFAEVRAEERDRLADVLEHAAAIIRSGLSIGLTDLSS